MDGPSVISSLENTFRWLDVLDDVVLIPLEQSSSSPETMSRLQ
jgi:hypothetical protein